MTVELPWPPSVNRYWRRTERATLAIGARGKAFRTDVLAACLEQLGAGWRTHVDPTARLRVRIMAAPPDRRRRDLDNVLKATLDALEHADVFRDDEQIDDLHIIRAAPAKPGRIVITIEETA